MSFNFNNWRKSTGLEKINQKAKNYFADISKILKNASHAKMYWFKMIV